MLCCDRLVDFRWSVAGTLHKRSASSVPGETYYGGQKYKQDPRIPTDQVSQSRPAS